MATKARMRTIDKAFSEIKASDPDTSLTRSGLRQIFMSGELKIRKIGRVRLVDMNALESYLLGAETKCGEPNAN